MEQLAIPGLELEPLDPFYDDVFAGMDEPVAGPWGAPHPLLDSPTAAAQQQEAQHTHFPAIDCNLLEEQAAAGADLPQQQHEQAGSSCAALPEPPAALHEAGSDSCHACGELQGSLLAAQPQQAPQEQQLLLQGADAACEAGWGGGSAHDSTELHSAGAAPDSNSAAGAAAAAAAVAADDSSADADLLLLLAHSAAAVDASSNSDVMEAPAAASNSAPGEPAAAAAEVTAPLPQPAGAAADPAAPAAAPAAEPEGADPSSGSLPDIDEVPEEQAGYQETQQQQQEDQQEPMQEAVPEAGQHSSAQQLADAAAPAPQPAGDSDAAGPPDSTSTHDAAAGAGHGPHVEPDSRDCPSSRHSADGLAAAAAGDGLAEEQEAGRLRPDPSHPGSSEAEQDEQRQLSVHADDFASPCSSWHSCVTAASKASSMNSSRGFWVAPAAAAAPSAAAGLSAVAATPAGGVAPASHAQDTADDEEAAPVPDPQQQQQQQSSKSGVSPPAMVSSLHLALQQQQQSQSQHSDQLAATAAFDDPLTAGLAMSVSSLAAGIAPGVADPESSEAAAAGAAGAPDNQPPEGSSVQECGSASQPITVQRLGRQQQQQEEAWQDVSPPSFSSSPGLLVSAAGARAALAAAQRQQGLTATASAAAGAAGASPDAADGPEEQQEEARDVVDDDVGHGCFYADAAGLSMSPDHGLLQQQLHADMALHRGQGLHPQQQQHQMAASSYMLRQSELVDLSLSTSMHPGQLMHQQQQAYHPGWLTAHQQLPPAAAQAVERAVVALNDSYCQPGRNSPSELLGTATAAAGPAHGHAGAVGGARAMGAAAMGAVGGAIRRSGAVHQWSRAHTQPQQDQQARHRLPSPSSAPGGGGVGAFGWPGAAVLGDWFSSTLQQPLAAAASRTAVGVGQRLGMANGMQQQVQGGPGRQHSTTNTGSGTRTAAHGHGAGGSSAARGPGAAPSGGSSAGPPSRLGAAGPAAVSCSSAAAAASAPGLNACAPAAGGGGCGDELGLDGEDAVLVEKTSDLPQSLQEQEDEAFRGLLFMGGRDSQGRPVVVVNMDAIPAGHNAAPRDAALAYLLKRLSPVVTRGPYVLVVVALHHGPQFRLLPGVWCVRAHQSLPHAFRKHVKHVILLQPSMLVKAAVTLLYPFVSSKAHAKVKQVQRLLDIDAATCGEVQVPHLGEAFLTTLHHINSSRSREQDSSVDRT